MEVIKTSVAVDLFSVDPIIIIGLGEGGGR